MAPTNTVTVLDVGFTLPQVLNTAGLVVNWMGTIPMIVIAISLGDAATALSSSAGCGPRSPPAGLPHKFARS